MPEVLRKSRRDELLIAISTERSGVVLFAAPRIPERSYPVITADVADS
jgi:hypothetical protein